jgi:hypothetical protein
MADRSAGQHYMLPYRRANINRQVMDVDVRESRRDRGCSARTIPVDVHAATREGRWRVDPHREPGAAHPPPAATAWLPAGSRIRLACPDLRATQPPIIGRPTPAAASRAASCPKRVPAHASTHGSVATARLPRSIGYQSGVSPALAARSGAHISPSSHLSVSYSLHLFCPVR